MIHDRLVCDSCWKIVPAKDRRRAYAAWREVRPFFRSYKSLEEIPVEDRDRVLIALREHRRQCAHILRAARDAYRNLPTKANPIEEDLRRMGLI